MHTNYVIVYGYLCYDLNTDAEHLYILGEENHLLLLSLNWNLLLSF